MNYSTLAIDVQVVYITKEMISKEMLSDIRKEGVTMADPAGAVWFGAYCQEELIGVACGVMNNKTGTVRFKSDYVAPEYRRQGVYKKLFKARMEWAKLNGGKIATAFCYDASLGMYANQGFISMRQDKKTGVTFVKRGIQW